MKKNLSVFVLSVSVAATLAACGGGGGVAAGQIPLPNAGPTSFVSAGHVVAASVYVDMDDSHDFSAADTKCATTALDGSYQCAYPAGLTHATNTHMLIASQGIDAFTGKKVNAPLLSAPHATQISPLTHLAMIQAASGVLAGTPVPLASYTASDSKVKTSAGLPVTTAVGTNSLYDVNSLALGSENYLAAETAVMAMMEQSVDSIVAAMGIVPTNAPLTGLSNLLAFYQAAFLSLSNQINTLAAMFAVTPTLSPKLFAPENINTVTGTVVNDTAIVGLTANPAWLNAAGSAVPALLSVTAVSNIVAVAKGPIVGNVNTIARYIAAPTTFTNIQTAAGNIVTNSNNTSNVIVQNQTIINTNTIINNTQVAAIAIATPVPVAPAIPSWTFGGFAVAGNGNAAIAASGVSPVATLSGSAITIPAAVLPVATGLKTASITLTPTAPTVAASAMDVGIQIKPTLTTDKRIITVVIKSVPVTVNATGQLVVGAGALPGAMMYAEGMNTAGTVVNATATLPAGLLSTAGDILSLDIPALFTALTGANAGFVNLTTKKGSFGVSMAVNVNNLGAQVPLLDTGATATLSNNAVATATQIVNGQGKIVTVVLN